MAIKTAKVVFSSFGVTTSNSPRKVLYLPLVEVRFVKSRRKMTINLADKYGMFDKKEPISVCVMEHFIVVGLRDMYLFYNEDGANTAKFPVSKLGTALCAAPDRVVFRRNCTITAYDANGCVVVSRKFTKKEIAIIESECGKA